VAQRRTHRTSVIPECPAVLDRKAVAPPAGAALAAEGSARPNISTQAAAKNQLRIIYSPLERVTRRWGEDTQCGRDREAYIENRWAIATLARPPPPTSRQTASRLGRSGLAKARRRRRSLVPASRLR